MSKTKRYSLWLMPSGEVYDRLKHLTSRLSSQYSAPDFEPHVTLIGKVLGSEEEIISKTALLASAVQPYRIELGRVEYLDEYFRCLFIRVRDTDEVMKADLEARKIFGRQNDPKYMPHLSLMYGNCPPETKKQIIVEIGEEFKLGFDAKSIHLFSTNVEPKDWYRVREFSLK